MGHCFSLIPYLNDDAKKNIQLVNAFLKLAMPEAAEECYIPNDSWFEEYEELFKNGEISHGMIKELNQLSRTYHPNYCWSNAPASLS